MQIEIPYSKTTLQAEIPDNYSLEHITPVEIDAAPDPLGAVESSLDDLLGDISWEQFSGAKSAAVAINDKTRPVPHQHLLPPLLKKLESLGIAPEHITLVIATGTHPVMPPEEYPWILPQSIIDRYPIICHDIDDKERIEYLGDTSRGTPVHINKAFIAADLRVVVGNVEPHQFMGFSGGVKSAVIGLAGKETINHNHAMMMHERAFIGNYDDNPMRQDVEEMGRMMRVDIAHNALLNGKKQIVEVLSGAPVNVMHAAIPRVREIFQVPISQPFDLLVVSPGGYPKDINVYQSQKALGHAILVMKEGGTVILCAACNEGTGSQSYEQWITDGTKHNHDDVFQHFKDEGFRVGPHKAYQISRDASRVRVMLISEMEPDFVRQLMLHPLPDLQTAIDKALEDLPESAHIGIMPFANATIPLLTITEA